MKIGTVPVFLIALAAQAQTLPELALDAGPDREARLVEGAKKEGALLFYTTFPPEYANQLIEPFERRYGVKVSYWRARSEIILSRALAEGRAGSATADVITTISPQLEAFNVTNPDQIVSFVSTSYATLGYLRPNSIVQGRIIGLSIQTRW